MIRQVKKMTAQFCEPKEPSSLIIDENSEVTKKLFSVIKDLSAQRQYLYKLLTSNCVYYETFGGSADLREEIKRVKREVEILENEKLNALYLFNQKIRKI